MRSWNRTDWLILILFTGLVALFYWRILTPDAANRQSFPPGDFYDQFWAFTTFDVRELGTSRLPLWNPYTFAGSPFWADVQAAVFYPPSLLTLLLSTPWGFSAYALSLEAIFHFWLAALFMYLFARAITQNRAAAVTAAVTFTFSGYLTGYPSQQLAVLEVNVWLPLILLFLYLAHRQSNPTFFILLAGVGWGIALLAGHPQSYLIVAYLSTAYLLFLWWQRTLQSGRKTTGHLARFVRSALPALAGFLLTGLALAGIQFIPAVEYTRLSVRAAGSYNEMSGGFPIIDLIQILLPGQVSTYSPLYIGIVGLVLAFWVTLTRPSRQTTFWGVTAMVSLLISFGGNTFFYSPLYLIGPGFSIFRGQERWAFAFAFSLSVLAGYGFKALIGQNAFVASNSRQLSRLAGYVFGFALLLTLAFFYGLTDTGWSPDSVFHGLLEAATILTLVAALAWLLWRFAPQLSTPLLTTATVALICFDLFSVNWQTNLFPQPPEWHTQMPAAVQAIKADTEESPGESYRVYNEFRIYDNYGVPFATEDLWGASPLRPSRYDEFLAPPMPIERTWELLNVKYVITWREELYVPSHIIYSEAAADGMTYVHRLDSVGPRAWLVNQAEMADDATILKTIADTSFDRWQTALLEPEGEPYIEQLGASAGGAANFQTSIEKNISSSQNSPGRISYRVTSSTPALFILSETYYPGWQATVDGEPAPLLRAYYILRALPVAAGEHTIELEFRPASFSIGAISSGLALLIVGAGLFLAARSGRSRRSQVQYNTDKSI